MTDKDIFRKAFQKVYKEDFAEEVFEQEEMWKYDNEEADDYYIRHNIFDILFLKAFFGEEIINNEIDENTITIHGLGRIYPEDERYIYVEQNIPAWQFHAQQMVIEEQPLKYLEQFLEK